jgi:hypothetical protein
LDRGRNSWNHSGADEEFDMAAKKQATRAKPKPAAKPKAKPKRNSSPNPRPKAPAAKRAVKKSPPRKGGKVTLLSGGNPQIAKGDGDAPVQAYIGAIPGWKRDIGKKLDALITRAVPNVRKAVKWNSPFYGVEEKTWFLSFHCFTNYVKIAFFRGASLKPMPPGASKSKDVRYLDLRESDPFDEAQLKAWITQASRLPGERM